MDDSDDVGEGGDHVHDESHRNNVEWPLNDEPVTNMLKRRSRMSKASTRLV